MNNRPKNHRIPAVYQLDYGEDVLAGLARQIIAGNAGSLPDLSRITVLLPDLQAAPRLRRLLLESSSAFGVSALIGPEIETLPGWVQRTGDTVRQSLLSPQQRELMLTEVLMEHPELYGNGSPWILARNLVELFDELTLHQARLPASYAELIERLTAAYEADQRASLPLSREATLVHTLWQAWHRQLQLEGAIESSTVYLLKLASDSARPENGCQLFLAGFHRLSKAERNWLKPQLFGQRANLFIQGGDEAGDGGDSYHPDAVPASLFRRLEALPHRTDPKTKTPVTRFLDAVYAHQGPPIRERARQFSSVTPQNPIAGRIFLFEAAGADEEARAIDIQVRRWLLDGCRQIGIVTENRRLARQVRALLEQGGVSIADSAGWALSTTSAAASLERWLQAVEEEFDQRPLLDLLRSPFLFAGQDREQLRTTAYRLENDIIRNGNIARGMTRYRQYLEKQRTLLPGWTEQTAREVRKLLSQLEKAAAPLSTCLQGERYPRQFIEALQLSMKRLEMDQALLDDDAGSCIIQQIEQLSSAAADSQLRMNWQTFRAWLGNTLERVNYAPPVSGSRVQLINLAQSALARYDALIVAAVEQEYLPGTPPSSPFFNDAVRAELGLPTARAQLTERFYLFRRLLQAAPRVVLTRRREQDGEEIIPSPWLENLRAFHLLAYNQELDSSDLLSLVRSPLTTVFRSDTTALPAPVSRPAPVTPPDLLPGIISASSYQQLMDCPYQFFVARCLKLAAPEAVREALAKLDYGERIHRCLEAFHSDLPDLPGPCRMQLDESNRVEASRLLEQIAEQVFAGDLEDNFMHRGWLQQWKSIIPDYIGWQLERATHYKLRATESIRKVERFTPLHNLRGRIDRIDQHPEGLAVIDYKTGQISNRDAIICGESVQLPFYALLIGDKVDRCEYLRLDTHGVKSCSVLEGETLRQIARDTGERLKQILTAISDGGRLPAWGDEKSCGHCSLAGVCRRQAWPENE